MLRTRVPAALLGLLCVLSGARPGPSLAQSLEEKAQLCAACHGEKGIPQEKTTPIIWGQHTGYAYLMLRDFKRGSRTNEQMTPIVEALEREDMLALAEYFSQKPWPRNEQPPASEEAAGKASRANVAVGCTGCHLGNYQGDSTNPRLAGQQKEYLAKTMLEIRSGKRANNPGMTTLMRATSEDEIAALAEYLAGLR